MKEYCFRYTMRSRNGSRVQLYRTIAASSREAIERFNNAIGIHPVIITIKSL